MDLADEIDRAIAEGGPATAKQLAARLRKHSIQVTKGDLNPILYRSKGRYLPDSSTPPIWSLSGAAAAVDHSTLTRFQASVLNDPTKLTDLLARRAPGAGQEVQGRRLYRWQRQALDAWRSRNRRGVVEAVTGTGKTTVGVAAVAEAVAGGGQALILVPTQELLLQWHKELAGDPATGKSGALPRTRIALRGAGHRGRLAGHDVLISVVNSARDGDEVLPTRRGSVLVADECHRYGSEGNAKALRVAFEHRLGLSATYARQDDGNTGYLDPYFGDVCYRIDYAEAIRDEVTAHFKVALVGVRFASSAEAIEYDQASERASTGQRWLIGREWAVAQPFGEFMKDVTALRNGEPRRIGQGDVGTAVRRARSYQNAFQLQRKLLAETASKLDALDQLLPSFRSAERSIIFTHTQAAAEQAAERLNELGLTSAVIHSDLEKDLRRDTLRRFERGELKALAAPRVLDEGIDVPAADFAVILASSKTERQMVQRMGRVLRRKPDGRLARFAIIYVENTAEDPDRGAHVGFIERVTDVADSVCHFPSAGSSPSAINQYLSDFEVPGGQPNPVWA